MGGGRFKLRRKLMHGRLNAADSESLNSSVPMRKVSRTKRLFWSLAFMVGVNMAVMGGSALLPKVAVAENVKTSVKKTSNTIAKKDKFVSTFQPLRKMFKEQKKNKIPVGAKASVIMEGEDHTPKEVKDFIRYGEEYFADFEDIPNMVPPIPKLKDMKSPEEKVKAINKYLGIKIDKKTPDYITPGTLDALDATMPLLNTHFVNWEIKKNIAEAKVEKKEGTTEPPEKVVTSAEEHKFLSEKESQKLIDEIDVYFDLCKEHNVSGYISILEGYKDLLETSALDEDGKKGLEKTFKEIEAAIGKLEKVEEAEAAKTKKAEEAEKKKAEEEAVIAKKWVERLGNALKTCEEHGIEGPVKALEKYRKKFSKGEIAPKDELKKLNQLLASIDTRVKQEKKKKAEEKMKVTEMTDLQKIDVYLGVLENLKDGDVFGKKAKTVKDATKQHDALSAVSKILEKKEKALNKQNKGIALTKKEKKALKELNKKQKKALDGAYVFILKNLETLGKQDILSGMPKKEFEKYMVSAKAEERPHLLESAANVLYNEANYIMYDNFDRAEEHLDDVINFTRTMKKYKLGKIKMPKFPNTVKGSFDCIDWLYETENQTYSDIVLKQTSKAETRLSEDAKDAARQIAKIHGERASLVKSYEQTASKKTAEKLYLGAMEELNLWVEHSELGADNEKELKEAKKKIELAEKYHSWIFDKKIPVDIHVLLPYKTALDAISLASPETFQKFELHAYAKGKEKDVSYLEKGVIGAAMEKKVPFIPFYGTEYQRGLVIPTGIHPALPRVDKKNPHPYGTSGTSPEMFLSNYGQTIGLVEHYEPEKLGEFKEAALAYGTYENLKKKVEEPAVELHDDLLDERVEILKRFFMGYGKGLAKIDDDFYYVVPLTALTVFNENKNAVSEAGKVSAVSGKELKSVKLAKLFYEAASLVGSKEKYKKLDMDKALKRGQNLSEFLATMPKDARKEPAVQNAIKLLVSKDKKSYVEGLISLQTVSEFGLTSIYKFTPSKESERFFRAAEVKDTIDSVPLIESQKIVLAEIATKDAELAKKAFEAGKLPIYVPEEVKKEIKISGELMGPYPKIATQQQPPVTVVHALGEKPIIVPDINQVSPQVQQTFGGKDAAEAALNGWLAAETLRYDATPEETVAAAETLRDSLPDSIRASSEGDQTAYEDALKIIESVYDPENENYENQEKLNEAMNIIRGISTIGGNLDTAYTEWDFEAGRNTVANAKKGGKVEFHFINSDVAKKIEKGERASGYLETVLTFSGSMLETPGEWTEYIYEESEKVPTGEKVPGKVTEKEVGAEAKITAVAPLPKKGESFFGKNMLLTLNLLDLDFGEQEVEGEIPLNTEEGTAKEVVQKTTTAKWSDLSMHLWLPDAILLKGAGGGVTNLWGTTGGFSKITPYGYLTLGYDKKFKKYFLGIYATGGAMVPIKEGDAEVAPFVGGTGVFGVELNKKLYMFSTLGLSSTWNSLGEKASITTSGSTELYIKPWGMALGLEAEYTRNLADILSKGDQNMYSVTGVIKFYISGKDFYKK